MNKTLVRIGKTLKTYREAAGLSQTDVSSRLGYTSPQLISNVERGVCALPADAVKKVAKMYAVDPHEICTMVGYYRIESYFSKAGVRQ